MLLTRRASEGIRPSRIRELTVSFGLVSLLTFGGMTAAHRADAHTRHSFARHRNATRHRHAIADLGPSRGHRVTSIPDVGGSPVANSGSLTLADGDSAQPSASFADVEIDRSDNTRGERLVRSALAFRGTPYRMGATGNGAFDCSGFTMYLFGKEGSSLPRTASEQYDKGLSVEREHLQLGDLVFFKNTYKSGISHVGIYIGNGSFVHASGYGRGVRVDSLAGAFYQTHWAGGRRPR